VVTGRTSTGSRHDVTAGVRDATASSIRKLDVTPGFINSQTERHGELTPAL
jgi:hypothetical protein